MEMEKIPTAEEYLINAFDEESGMKMPPLMAKAYKKVLINFTKLHVEAQEKAISEKVSIKYGSFIPLRDYYTHSIDKDSITNAYPINNIV